MTRRILAVLDTYPALSETFLYNTLENLSSAGFNVSIRARRRGKSPHLPCFRDVRYLPSEELPILTKIMLTVWYAICFLFASPRAFVRTIRYLQVQPGGLRQQGLVAFRILPLLYEQAEITYLSFGGLAVKYVDYVQLASNVYFSLRGSDINIEPLLDVKYKNALQIAMLKACKVHCVSNAVKQKALEIAPDFPGKFEVIYTSVNPIFTQDDTPPQNMTTQICIISTGRLDWKKGFEHGLVAVRELLDRGIPCSWNIIGEGPYRVALEWAVRDMGLADFVSLQGGKTQAELCKALHNSDIFFHPSVSEGLSNSVLEAMAVGLPVVSTSVGGMPEAVEHGQHGFLVESRNWKAMADALEELARDDKLRKRMGQASRERIRQQFTPEKQIADFQSFFAVASSDD